MARAGNAVTLSEDHKPENQVELARITAAGSRIEHDGHSYRVEGNLNLSRALGDFRYKKVDGKTPEEQPITANPDIHQVQLGESDTFIILGCDGVWERIKNPNEACVKHVLANQEKVLSENIGGWLDTVLSPNPEESKGEGCDNMTIVALKLPKIETTDKMSSLRPRKELEYKDGAPAKRSPTSK